MRRIFTSATIVWLAGFAIAHAQSSSDVTAGATPGATSGATPGAAPGMTPGTIPGPTAGTVPRATAPTAMFGVTGQTRTSCSTASLSAGGLATAVPCASDPLNLPTATLSPSGITTGGAFASTSGFSSVGSVSSSFGSSIGPVSSPISAQTLNPERALQLPGEAPNTATQAPIAATQDQGSSASRAGVPSAALCSAAIPSSAGTTNPVNLFAGASVNGC
jgi:hypothetical protein